MKPSPDQIKGVLQGQGLDGWRAIVTRQAETTRWVAVLTSPDYNPVTRPPSGRLFAAFAEGVDAALDAAIDKAKAAIQ